MGAPKSVRWGAALLLLVPAVWLGVARAGDSGLSPHGREILEEKQRLHALEESTFLPPEETVPPSPAAGPPSPEPPPKWEEGLFGRERAADFPTGMAYEFESVWTQVIDGNYVAIYTGVRVTYDALGVEQPTDSGAVLVLTIEPTTWEQGFAVFDPPIEGPVKILKVTGHQLTLESASGETAVFDADALVFEAGPSSA